MVSAPLHVLVVEDDPLFVRTLQLQLGGAAPRGRASFLLTFASNAALGLQQLRRGRFDAVLLDLHLGEHEDGLSALPKLTAAAPGVPVVVHSVATDHATIVQAMRAGAYDYLPKHLGVHTLAEQLAALVARFGGRSPSVGDVPAGASAFGSVTADGPRASLGAGGADGEASGGVAAGRSAAGDDRVAVGRRGGHAAALAPRRGAQRVRGTVPGTGVPPLERGPAAATDAAMVGEGEAMQRLRAAVAVARRSRGNVLVTGPSGAGKELVARALACPGEPFVAVDAATLEGQLAASALFGHERGAFTGADSAQVGLFERAHGGTLYFDEVANMPLEVQAKLLRVLQEREVWPLGARAPRALQFRLVCATNAVLSQRVQRGQFRADLLCRMQVFTLQVPSLRERREDVPALFAHLLARHGGVGRRWDAGVARALAGAPFVGNVRELENAAVVALAHAGPDQLLRPEHLPPTLARWAGGPPPFAPAKACSVEDEDLEASLVPLAAVPAMPEAPRDFYALVRAFERRTLIRAFAEHRGNISAMARTLGMDRSSLYAKLRLYAIHVPRAV